MSASPSFDLRGTLATYLLRVRHRNLSDQSADVREQVEVHVDARRRHDGVYDDALARLGVADEQLRLLVLLCDQRRYVGLQSSGTETHDDNCDDKACERAFGVLDHTGDRRDDEKAMAKNCDDERDAGGLVATLFRVGNVRGEERDNINPVVSKLTDTDAGGTT